MSLKTERLILFSSMFHSLGAAEKKKIRSPSSSAVFEKTQKVIGQKTLVLLREQETVKDNESIKPKNKIQGFKIHLKNIGRQWRKARTGERCVPASGVL